MRIPRAEPRFQAKDIRLTKAKFYIVTCIELGYLSLGRYKVIQVF